MTSLSRSTDWSNAETSSSHLSPGDSCRWDWQARVPCWQVAQVTMDMLKIHVVTTAMTPLMCHRHEQVAGNIPHVVVGGGLGKAQLMSQLWLSNERNCFCHTVVHSFHGVSALDSRERIALFLLGYLCREHCMKNGSESIVVFFFFFSSLSLSSFLVHVLSAFVFSPSDDSAQFRAK